MKGFESRQRGVDLCFFFSHVNVGAAFQFIKDRPTFKIICRGQESDASPTFEKRRAGGRLTHLWF